MRPMDCMAKSRNICLNAGKTVSRLRAVSDANNAVNSNLDGDLVCKG